MDLVGHVDAMRGDRVVPAHDDEPRTMYIRAAEVTAVMPIHPRQVEAELDEPPDWYSRD